MRFSKKASLAPAATLFYIFLLIMATILFLLTLDFLGTTKTRISTIPPRFEENIFVYRFLCSSECFVYENKDIGKSYPFIIDYDKFTSNRLEYCYNNKKTDKGFKLTLLNKETGEKNEIQTPNFMGSVGSSTAKDITIYKGGKTYNGQIFIEKNYVQ